MLPIRSQFGILFLRDEGGVPENAVSQGELVAQGPALEDGKQGFPVQDFADYLFVLRQGLDLIFVWDDEGKAVDITGLVREIHG